MRRALDFVAPILIVSTSFLLGAAARAQTGGYMRALTAHGQVAGESTDPHFNGWIPLRSTIDAFRAANTASMADESNAARSAADDRAVHRPVTLVKEMDKTRSRCWRSLHEPSAFPRQ